MGLLLAKRFIVKVSFRPSIAVYVLVLFNGISTVVFALPSLAKLLFAHPGDALRLLGGQASSCRFLDFKGVGTTALFIFADSFLDFLFEAMPGMWTKKY